MTYNTGNPVPSIDPRDLDDNAEILDNFVNGADDDYPDRLGVARKSLAGMEAEVAAFSSPNVMALSGLTGEADKLPYFTGPGAMALATLTAAARTVLDDTTVAAMLATMGGAPIASPTFTGTPAAPTAAVGTNTTQLATMAALRAMILGTVSQSGGAATGAIFQTTYFTGGWYTKFADGRLEHIRITDHAGVAITTGIGSSFYSSTGLAPVAFATPFIAPPLVHTDIIGVATPLHYTQNSIPTTTQGPGVFLMYPLSLTVNVTRYELAIGRWF